MFNPYGVVVLTCHVGSRSVRPLRGRHEANCRSPKRVRKSRHSESNLGQSRRGYYFLPPKINSRGRKIYEKVPGKSISSVEA